MDYSKAYTSGVLTPSMVSFIILNGSFLYNFMLSYKLWNKRLKWFILVCLQVAERFIKAVEQSSSTNANMSFFISCDANNILEQAAESTIRHKKGMKIKMS